MNENQFTSISKYISRILRHSPEIIGLRLDADGWADTRALLAGINRTKNYRITIEILEEIVRTDQKQRYSFNSDKSRIRANYGHSVPAKIHHPEKEPPEILYHGTARRFLDSILKDGLLPMGRQYVHLSEDTETATLVGTRHGTPCLFEIPAREMHKQGYHFYQAPNGVWLTDSIPPEFLKNIQY